MEMKGELVIDYIILGTKVLHLSIDGVQYGYDEPVTDVEKFISQIRCFHKHGKG